MTASVVNSLSIFAYVLLMPCSQTDGFASDSMRMIKEVKKGKADAQVQILLFSATFDDTIKTFAHNIVGGAANQVSTHPLLLQFVCKWQVQLHSNRTNSFQLWHRKACS